MNSARDLVLGTAGHIDHGKTSLVRALTGVDTDRLPQEKQRGITIDLGYASLELGEIRLALVDVPGHERFIRNMLAGATAIDLALLVIACDDSVMPQTREHLQILRLLGVRAGVIALTKSDLVDPAWIELVESDVRAFVKGTFLDGAPIVRTSAARGEGLDDLRRALETAARAVRATDSTGLFRLAIDRVFAVDGHGTVVTGTVASGSASVGAELELWPKGTSVRVRGLQRHDRAVDSVGRGCRAALNLAGVHHSEIARGHELAAPGYLRSTRLLTVAVQAAPDAPRPLRHRKRYVFHAGTAAIQARLLLFDARSELAPGESCTGQIVLPTPTTVIYGQPFVLRDESPAATLGGGHVLEPTPRRIRRRDALAGRADIGALTDSPPRRVERALERAGLAALNPPALVRETGLPSAMVEAQLSALRQTGELIELPIGARRRLELPRRTVEALQSRILREVARRHAAQPRLSHVPRAAINGGLEDLESAGLVAALIERSIASGALVGDSRRIALSQHRATLSQNETRLKAKLLEAIKQGGFSPPTLDELLLQTKAPAPLATELLALLVEEDQLCPIAPGLWLAQAAEADLRSSVRAALGGRPDGIAMSDLRDLLQTTRKYAVPIGEYLDRVGLTRRDGERRFLSDYAMNQQSSLSLDRS